MNADAGDREEGSIADPDRVDAVRRALGVSGDAVEGLHRWVRLASRLLQVPVVLVSFVDNEREIVKVGIGLPEPWGSQGWAPLSHSICASIAASGRPLVANDARAHPDLREHPSVLEMGAASYAGFPLRGGTHVLGAFCVADVVARSWSANDLQLLEDVAAAVSTELRLRVALDDLERSRAAEGERERQLRELAANLAVQARTDPLTGVANRRAADERLADEAARARRYGTPLSMAMIDLDHFKALNDTRSHQDGDAALREVAARLRRTVRQVDVLARVGGDEFVLLLPDTDADAAAVLAERARRVIEAEPVVGSHVTVTIGIGVLVDGDTDRLHRDADAALYAAKAAGRNTVRVARPGATAR